MNPLIAAVSEETRSDFYLPSVNLGLSCAVSPRFPSWQRFTTPPPPCAISVEDCKCTSQIKALPDSPVTKSMQIRPLRASCGGAWTGADTLMPLPQVLLHPSRRRSLNAIRHICTVVFKHSWQALNKLLRLLYRPDTSYFSESSPTPR